MPASDWSKVRWTSRMSDGTRRTVQPSRRNAANPVRTTSRPGGGASVVAAAGGRVTGLRDGKGGAEGSAWRVTRWWAILDSNQ